MGGICVLTLRLGFCGGGSRALRGLSLMLSQSIASPLFKMRKVHLFYSGRLRETLWRLSGWNAIVLPISRIPYNEDFLLTLVY